MKLNLLPATVSKGRQAKTAWVASVVIIIAGIGISLVLTLTSAAARKDAEDAYQASIGPAQKAYDTSVKADAIMAQPAVAALSRNVSLAQAMIQHNDAYPDLYNSLSRYIPPFFRLTSLNATPISGEQASVTMVGTLNTYQQYADLMLALMRNPEAVSVARSGYTADETYVPQLTQVDQFGRPRKPGENPIPDDPLERLAFFQAQGGTDPYTYTGTGNFGTGNDNTRQAMPGESLVTVQLILNHALMTPNPRATLGGGGGTNPGLPTGTGRPNIPGPGAGTPPGPGGTQPGPAGAGARGSVPR
jgi:Tfp pilus assembly protein PilN